MKQAMSLLVFLLALGATPAHAQFGDVASVLPQLKGGGYVIVFRHGATHRDQADTDPLNPENVAKQRHLSDPGRQVARQVGESFKKLGIPLGKVYTSRFQRAVDTGRLVSGGEVITSNDITEGGLVVTPIENDRRTDAFRKLVAVVPERGTNTLIVSHKPNIIDAFGKDWFEIREGEASVFKPGGAKLVLRLQAADWIKAAAGL